MTPACGKSLLAARLRLRYALESAERATEMASLGTAIELDSESASELPPTTSDEEQDEEQEES